MDSVGAQTGAAARDGVGGGVYEVIGDGVGNEVSGRLSRSRIQQRQFALLSLLIVTGHHLRR
jgi:hypothetical protein